MHICSEFISFPALCSIGRTGWKIFMFPTVTQIFLFAERIYNVGQDHLCCKASENEKNEAFSGFAWKNTELIRSSLNSHMYLVCTSCRSNS